MLPCGHKTNSPSVGWLDSAGFCLLSSPPPRERKDRKTGEVKEREGRGERERDADRKKIKDNQDVKANSSFVFVQLKLSLK